MATEQNKKKKKATNSNRLHAIYILLVLKNHSSANEPLSIVEITELVNTNFFHKTYDGEDSINSSTVSRTLDAIMTDLNLAFKDVPMSYYDDQTNIGCNLYCVMEGKDGEWIPYEAPDVGKGPKKYYYYDSIFSDHELLTLVDSVETYNYFSSDDIAGLVEKLLSLRPQSELVTKYHASSDEKLKDSDSLVLANIDEFSRLIKEQKFAEITYCNYDYNHKLVPRDGYPRLIRPLDMMWSNGYYYLVALFRPGYAPANLRIDRIETIVPYDPTPEMINAYQADVDLAVSTYRMYHPVMHGGKIEHIKMLYLDTPKFCMSNAMMDTFGKTTRVRPASKEEILSFLPAHAHLPAHEGTWYRADFQATTGGTELFATQYSPYCKVISPSSLSEKVQANLQKGLSLYQL